MASSNRHWPSMFKSKPCNSHHQWQHDINSALVSSNACQRTTPYAASSGCEERSPEPKPRWNPRPEQIRILEAIFNSGMVNPPREEIRKIRAQLQEYGQVGDANVFYWFQNRKSRSKHKQRHGQTNGKLSQPTKTAALSSSSSSSEKSSQNSADKTLSLGSRNVVEHASSSPTASVNQPFFQPFFFPVQPPPPPPPAAVTAAASLSQGLCFPDPQNSTNLLLSDLLLMNHAPTKKMDDDDNGDEDDRVKLHHHQQPLSAFTMSSASAQGQSMAFSPTTNGIALSTVDHIQGFVGENGSSGPIKPTVFINDVAFEVTSAPFNVREAFGDDAMLLNSSGLPVLTNEWGVTLQPLQHGAFYYLIRTLTSPPHDTTIHLI